MVVLVVIFGRRAGRDGRGELRAVEAYVLEVVRLAADGRLGEAERTAVGAIDERHGGRVDVDCGRRNRAWLM